MFLDHEEDSNEIRSCTDMEIKAIKFAESGNLDQALLMINEAIHLVPFKPSLYNNRAHIYQYMRKFEGKGQRIKLNAYFIVKSVQTQNILQIKKNSYISQLNISCNMWRKLQNNVVNK